MTAVLLLAIAVLAYRSHALRAAQRRTDDRLAVLRADLMERRTEGLRANAAARWQG